MDANYEAEIVALHEFFEGWFNAQLPNTDAAFARFADALTGEFEMVTPDGAVRPRAALLESLRGAHGMHAGSSFRIAIEDVALQWESASAALVTYTERHITGAGDRARRSSVLFERGNGLRWVFVQETWRADG